MSDARSRRTGDHNPQLIKLAADAAVMREQMDALEGRVLRLEAELAAVRASAAKGRPPPLPTITVGKSSVPPRKATSRRAVVDISEIAELVESIPPPPRAPRR
jgi:hypothetical protein